MQVLCECVDGEGETRLRYFEWYIHSQFSTVHVEDRLEVERRTALHLDSGLVHP